MSSTPLASALGRIIEAASLHVRLLHDAHGRPEIDRAGLSQSSLELLLEAIAAQAARLRADPSLPADLRTQLDALVTAEKALRDDSVQVQRHLLDLAAGWQCARCRSEVASAAVIQAPFTSASAVRVSLECRECGARGDLTEAGRAQFGRWFGHLVRPDWQPVLNGFRVEGTNHVR